MREAPGVIERGGDAGIVEPRGEAGTGDEMRAAGAVDTVNVDASGALTGTGVATRWWSEGRGTTCSTSGTEARPAVGARTLALGCVERPAAGATGMRDDDGASSAPTGSPPGTPRSSCRKITST